MKKIFIIILVIGLLIIISWKPVKVKEKETILYSWDINDVMSDKSEFENIRKKYNINTLYQDFDNDFFTKKDSSFMKYMDSLDIKVYQLGGDPSWGKKNGFLKIKKEIDRVFNYNQKNRLKIKGIMLDIEPYVSEKEEKFSKTDFLVYATEIGKAYTYAQTKGLEMRIAIPYWLDHIDKDLLEQLIENCDGISVMNYDISKTKEAIKDEYALASKYQKKIDTIYEINYGKEDYFSSLKEIQNDFNKLKKEYLELTISYHHLKSIKKSDV